jgi:exosome complex component RRP4
MKNEINEVNKAEEAGSSKNSKKREVVVPGEVIVKGEDYLPGEGTRREGENVVASRFGLADIAGRVIRVIPISGAFVPRRGNVVLGRVTDITFRGWIIDVDYAISGFLAVDEVPRFIAKSEMSQFLGVGDIVAAKIFGISNRGTDLTVKGKGLGKLENGFIFRVIPSRVPRIIGREGSMINLIKERTDCSVTVGQNGWVWVKGPSIDAQIKARKAIEFVAEKVYVNGLTEKMEGWFEKN